MADRSGDMTLAFTLEALERLADPVAAIEDARTWSSYLGGVSARPNGALSFTKERRVRLDFFSGTRTPAETLFAATSNYHTERYVLVGTEEQANLPPTPNWEFRTIEDAADAAGWDLGGADDERGLLGTLRDRLGGGGGP